MPSLTRAQSISIETDRKWASPVIGDRNANFGTPRSPLGIPPHRQPNPRRQTNAADCNTVSTRLRLHTTRLAPPPRQSGPSQSDCRAKTGTKAWPIVRIRKSGRSCRNARTPRSEAHPRRNWKPKPNKPRRIRPKPASGWTVSRKDSNLNTSQTLPLR